jgi:hypothetical protein
MPWRCMGEFLDLGTSWKWVVSFTPLPLYPQGRAPGIQWIGGWVDPRVGLDDVEKRKFLTLLGLKLWPLGHPSCSKLLYQLCYPGVLKNLDLDTKTDLSVSNFGKFQMTAFALCGGKKKMQCIRIIRLAALAQINVSTKSVFLRSSADGCIFLYFCMWPQ